MKEILIFAGTTEGRLLSEHLVASGIAHTLCVATEYGEIVLKEHPLAKVHCGRMTQEEMKEYIESHSFLAVVDATHPYAKVVTQNIKAAMKDLTIPYLRLKRETKIEGNYDNIVYFADNESCAKALQKVKGNLLLTTGSKELGIYCAEPKVKDRLYVRVLPGLESLRLCMDQGIGGRQILALQGPFSTQLNEALICQYQIKCLITKASGRTGGFLEKLEAAKKTGIPMFVVGQGEEEQGDSLSVICRKLEEICGQKVKQEKSMEIVLAGVGMGSRDGLTKEVSWAIESADILLGAKRLIEEHHPGLEKKPFYMASQIVPYLQEIQAKELLEEGGKVVILFSGDSGFYSGCEKLYQALQEEIRSGGLAACVHILPGISSVSYLAACIGESYQDAAIYSMHGKKLLNLTGIIQREKKLFLLMSGVKDVNKLGRILLETGLEHCEVLAGYQLSYPNQQLLSLTPQECCEREEDGLYICCIKNPQAQGKRVTPGRADSEFIREKVPMTKEEVREVSLCKLKLQEGAVLYDIGSGTGSIAVEAAGLSDSIQVYAIEHKEEAVSLIKRNQEKFRLENMQVIPTMAPEGLTGLPLPTHAFIGGSGGRLKEILNALYQRNPHMRIVINAISMETIGEIKEILDLYPVEQEEVVQLQVSRTKKVGDYHLMQAENPVWIAAFNFVP